MSTADAASECFLVVGSNAREHAIARRLRASALCKTLACFASSNNPGIRKLCDAFTVGQITDPDAVAAFAKEHGVTTAVVGPEAPLEAGVVDALEAIGIGCVGPTRALAQLESSKAFTRDLLVSNAIGACPEYATVTSMEQAREFIKKVGQLNYVVKADGLCGGKGVKVGGEHLHSDDEALAFIHELLAAGGKDARVVLEQKLVGQEFSLMSFCDGETCAHMPPIQDHKRAHEGDTGPNTGGMGTYSGAGGTLPFLSADDLAHAQRITEAVSRALKRKCGAGYKGILYGGFMVTARGVFVIEYNARFGDPEAMNALALLETDFGLVARAIAQGTLEQVAVSFSDRASCCVYAVPEGYPAAGAKGAPIDTSRLTPELEECLYFAAVDQQENTLVTTGSRAIASCALAPTLQEAAVAAVQPLGALSGRLWHRSDIGTEAPVRKRIGHMMALRRAAPRAEGVKIGVIASGGATALQPVLEAIAAGDLNASVEVVVSNKPGALALSRAEQHGIPAACVPSKGVQDREAYDRQLSAALESRGVQLVLAVGWMRILSPWFCRRWARRALNVHPSLLPDFAGGMDLEVHRAVLAANKRVSGCSIHFVEDVVDGGEIVYQATVPVLPGDTPESLKARVQPQEGPSFVKAIRQLQRQNLILPSPSHAQLPAVKAGGDSSNNKPITYREAGVDIDAGDELVRRIKPACARTRRSGCVGSVGGFGGLFDPKAAGYSHEALLCAGTDGVGTKLMIAQAAGYHDGIGVDLVAMVVNDLVVQGAEPLFFLDYFATGKLSVDAAAAIVGSIARGCEESGCALIGGETAEMPGMYGPGHYDLAGFAVGAVEPHTLLPKLDQMGPGDCLIGVPSSGVHSNGYSLVRKLVTEVGGLTWGAPAPWESQVRSVSSSLLTPTKLYVKSCLPLAKAGLLKGMAHITGGGLIENIPRVLPDGLAADIDVTTWALPPVFKWLAKTGRLDARELGRTFNCGIGMVLIVAADKVHDVLARLNAAGEPSYHIGTLSARDKGAQGVKLSGTDAWGLTGTA